ncbi:MAG TPA: alpha/beta fold hydrolase [Acidimicrobiales bacterium]|nr:alpha/beta fold hydrolase [Acidimicrobiales bacterium]|tara:strand:+ start:2053 stop:2739 length:687 start_codon:yes stop_codon:yes gene_type:complete
MSNPPIVLVHGLGTSAETTWYNNGWVDLIQDAGREVHALDLLGHGNAPKPTDPEEYREVTRHLLDGFPEVPVDIVAFSHGARLVLEIAIKNPERFHRIVLAGIGENLFREEPERRTAIFEAIESGQSNDPELRYFADLPNLPGGSRSALTAFMRRPGTPKITEELLANVTCPVLVVLGDNDFAGPAGPLVSALPDSIFVELKGVDHFATPKDFGFIDAALTFLDAQPF